MKHDVLIRWEKWRRFLRRHGLPVPAFMIPPPRPPRSIATVMVELDGQYAAARMRLRGNERYEAALADPSIWGQNVAALMVEVEIDNPTTGAAHG